MVPNKPPGLPCAFKVVAGTIMAASPSANATVFKDLVVFIELRFKDLKI